MREFTVMMLVVAMTGPGLARAADAPDKASPLPPPVAEVRIEHKFDDAERKAHFEIIARSEVAFYETRVAPTPAVGRMPIVVVPSADWPRADVGVRQYNLLVTCLDEPWPTRLAYQLGHELGHLWIGPFKSGLFKECVCTALSFIAIDELARQWRDCPPSPWFASQAENMQDYHDRRTFQGYLDQLGLKDVDAAMEWVRTDAETTRMTQEGVFTRDEEQVVAKIIERVLQRHPGQWGALAALKQVEFRGMTGAGKFAEWHALVAPEQKPLVADLAATLGFPIEAASAGTNSPAGP